MKICLQCLSQFEITQDDLKFYDKISPIFNGVKYQIPEPALCPDCRQQRRMVFRNERNLYHRKSDLSGKQIISNYSPDKNFPVYDQHEWWSDKWDALDYGKDFDFSKKFSEQWKELFISVPRISLINKEADNSEYANFSWRNKNSYLIFTSGQSENAYYSTRLWGARDVCDCSNLTSGELCYEVLDSKNCYHCIFLQNCADCYDCMYSYDLQGCKNCIACFGLVQKEYCINNKQFSVDEYHKEKEKLLKFSKMLQSHFRASNKINFRKYIMGVNIEDCSGNLISDSKNSHFCFEVKNLQNCKYVCNATGIIDGYDINNDDHSELVYEAIGSESNYCHLFNDICWFNSQLLYCSLCFHSSNLFGCVGLKHKEYCILNKQYTKEEYEKFVPQIIEHMKNTGEWGEFFPVTLSPFAYNETIAQDYFPLNESQVLAKGWKWKKEEEKQSYIGPKVEIPDSINEVDDSICSKILSCEVTGKPYKIIPQELAFYKKMNLPLPRRCPDQRHKDRLALRNPRKLWNRNCGNCGKGIQTTYSPDRPEKVFCEECYLKAVY